MNEQIRELADRLWRVHPKDIDAMGLKTRTEFYEHELKKFAEMIVEECIREIGYKSVELLDIDFYPHYQERLKKHFGVE